MSNIVLKGDVIQNIGEYLPNPYIEKVTVEKNGSGQVSLEIEYSLMFMVSDEYGVGDIEEQLGNLHLFAFCRESDKALDKKSALEKYSNRISYTGSPIYSNSDLINDIIVNLSSNDYDDNLYDSDDRQIIKVTSTAIINEIPHTDIQDESFYLYMFTSVLSDSDITTAIGFDMAYLNTSNIAYEKVFSPNLRIVKQELPIYLTSDASKYGRTPLLGLDKNYYQNRTVTREQITSKVRSLISRFDGSSNTSLQENINNIKYVLSEKGESEDLLVELDKTRRAFTSKTNNNPVGNLYAAYSVLLQNMNSSFPRTEKLNKQKYLTGKVFDLRTNNNGSKLEIERPDGSDDYITNPTLSRRVNETTSKEDISGVFFVNLEQLAKDKAQFFDYTTPDKFYEVATAENLPSLKAALFSYFKAKKIMVEVLLNDDGSETELLKLTKRYQNQYNTGDIYTIEQAPGQQNVLDEPYYYFNEQQINVMAYSYSATGNEIITPDGAISFEYNITFTYEDTSHKLLLSLIAKYFQSLDKYNEYISQAQQICSYNNITNNFNNFFSKSVKAYWDDLGVEYPWEMMPTMYAIMSYLTTDTFGTFEEASEYARSVAHNISPDTGNLDFVENRFKPIVDDLYTNVLYGLQSSITAILQENDATGGAIIDSISNTHNITNAPADSVDTSSGNTSSDGASSDGTLTASGTVPLADATRRAASTKASLEVKTPDMTTDQI